jgi:flagellar assembly protein FliH
MPPAHMSPTSGSAAVDPGATAEELAPIVNELAKLRAELAEARQEVAEIGAIAHGSGAQQGYNEGLQQARAEVQHQLMEAIATMTSAQTERERLAKTHQGAIAHLAMRIAQRVVGEHIALDPTLVTKIVEGAIGELEPSSELTIRVNPEDLPILEAHRATLDRMLTADGTVRLIADDTVGRGGCILVTAVGDVDARVETKLGVIETAIAAQRAQADAEPASTANLASEIGGGHH